MLLSATGVVWWGKFLMLSILLAGSGCNAPREGRLEPREGRLEGHAFHIEHEGPRVGQERVEELRLLKVFFYKESDLGPAWSQETTRREKLIDEVAIKARPLDEKMAATFRGLKELAKQGKSDSEAANLLETQTEAWNSAVAPLNGWNDSLADAYFKALPEPLARVTTDTDGRFFVMLPKSTPLVVAARIEKTFDREAKRWLLRLNL
jgi:hypothetical protein